MAVNKSIIGVTDTGATITIDDGNSVESPAKTSVKVSYTGDDVSLVFPATDQTGLTTWTANFADYTAPTGASAAAVANAIEAFMDITMAISEVTPGTDADNLGKAVGNAAGATDVGVATLAIRDDVLTTLGDPDGDYVQLRTSSTGALWTRDAVLDAVVQGTGTELRVDALSVVPGTGATNLGKAVGNAAAATDTGVATLAIRDDVLSALSDPDGDYVPLRTSSTGALWTRDAVLDAVLQGTGTELRVDIISAIPAGENHLGEVGGVSDDPSASFTRPANATAYVSGQLVANSTVAGSVVALAFTAARVAAGSFVISRARLHLDSEIRTNAIFRLHLFKTDPTATNPSGGDGAALELNSLPAGDSLGYFDFDFTAASDIQASDIELAAAPAIGNIITVSLASGTTLYGLLEARAAYTPTSGEVITAAIELLQD